MLSPLTIRHLQKGKRVTPARPTSRVCQKVRSLLKPFEPNTNTRVEKTESTLTPDQQTALMLLGQLFEAAKGIEDEQFKIKAQAQIADLFWPYDEPRARQQFEEAFRAIDPAKFPKQQNSSSLAPSSQTSLSPILQLRSEVLKLVSKHDPSLAEKLIKSVAEESSESVNKESDAASRSSEAQSSRSELYLQAAISIANTDPGRAAQLAKLSLNSGIRTSLLKVLLMLRQKSPAVADELFNSALSVARLDTGHIAANIRILAPYVFPDFGGVGSSSTYNRSMADQTGNPTIIRFLNFAYDLMAQQANAAQAGMPITRDQTTIAPPNIADYLVAQQLVPFFSQYMAEKAPTFRVFMDMISRSVTRDQGSDLVAKTSQADNVEDAVRDAEAAQDPLQKDLLYFRSAMLSLNGGEFDRALSLTEKVNDAEFRSGLDSIIRAQATAASIGKNDIDSAFRYAKGVSDVRQRAALFGKIARALIDKKDTARAREVLNDAEKLISKADEGLDKAQAMLIIAGVKTRLDPVQGFETMEAAIKEFNRADSGIDEKKATGGGSILAMMMNKVMRLETPDFDQIFPLLARADFNRALQLAQALKKKDRSVLAQLSVFRGILIKKEKRG